jgi:hypothetical protein
LSLTKKLNMSFNPVSRAFGEIFYKRLVNTSIMSVFCRSTFYIANKPLTSDNKVSQNA